MNKLFLVTLALGLAGAGCSSASPAAPSPSATNKPTPPVQGSTTQTATAPSVAPQPKPNGLKLSTTQKGSPVVIDDVTLEKPSFVAIHQDKGGKPDLVLTTSNLLPTGETKQVTIPVALAAGKAYWAEIRVDNGDGKWNEAQDLAAPNSKDKPTLVQFRESSK